METLRKNIEQLGYVAYIIDKGDWKYLDFKEVMKPNSVFVFDTLVGCGEFGEMHPNEVAKEKWKDAYGLMRCHSKHRDNDNKGDTLSVSFSVIPKHIVEDKETVKLFLNVESTCNSCGKVTAHAIIYHNTKQVLCVNCDYEIKEIMKNIKVWEVKIKN